MPALELNLPFDLNVDLIALADMLAAAAVTAHVLLRKRDVRAAIGWIGLAWLSPITGPALYYFFGINRVTRRASRNASMNALPRRSARKMYEASAMLRRAPPMASSIAE